VPDASSVSGSARRTVVVLLTAAVTVRATVRTASAVALGLAVRLRSVDRIAVAVDPATAVNVRESTVLVLGVAALAARALSVRVTARDTVTVPVAVVQRCAP
jgi:hypothetical protein